MATIAYADLLDIQPLPIDAQSIVTDPRLVIAGNSAGLEAGGKVTILETWLPDEYTYILGVIPLPVTYSNPSALHATYKASRGMAFPPGVNPWIEPANLAVSMEPALEGDITNAGSPSAVRDGDELTYAESSLASTAPYRPQDAVALTYATPEGTLNEMFFGCRLRYTLSQGDNPQPYTDSTLSGAPGSLRLRMKSRHRNAGDIKMAYTVTRFYALPYAAEPNDVYMIAPFDARGHADNIDRASLRFTPLPLTHTYLASAVLTFAPQGAGANLKIYEFYPLMIDTVQADAICKRNYRLPAVTPKRITVAGYVAPSTEHTITGWPGGDYTGTVARQTYGGGITIIDFEQAGAPTLDAQAVMEAERARQHVESRKRSRDTYNLVMGERQ